MSKDAKLRDFWTPQMSALAREKKVTKTYHSEMIALFGVARPGKTRRDRHKKGESYGQ